MKKAVYLSMVCSSLLLAQEAVQLDTVKVISTATKSEKKIDGVAASVEVITELEIKKMGAESLKDVLNKTSGLTVQYGTFPSASSKSKSSISIRGMSANGTLFLIDGRRLAGEVKNPYDLDRIPASSIERIEIVKGPMSSLYGADATGGVVNIITKKPSDKPEVNLGIRYGQNGDGDAKNKNISFNARGKESKIRYSVYANKTNTTPYTQMETANTKIGPGEHAPTEIPALPGYLNPTGKTGGKPMYVQADGSVKPMPLNPANVANDIQYATDAFNAFKNFMAANVPSSYDTDVTYREESDIITFGTRLDYDMNDKTTIGFDLNFFKEERLGTYNGYFHPIGMVPPLGHPNNPIVGYDASGNPLSMFQANQMIKGRLPAFNVPVNSKDENKRLDLGLDYTSNLTDDLLLKLRVYRSHYKKRNTTTVKHYQDLGWPSEEKSASNGMNANVDVTSYEAMINYMVNEVHLVTAGAEYRDEEREASVFDSTPNMDIRKVDYKSVYLQDDWQINDSLNTIIGARYDQVSNADNKATFKLGVVKQFSQAANVRAIFAQGYRTPDIREMYINKQTPNGLQQGADVVGYDLKPEFTNTYELGMSGRTGKFTYDAAVFFNDIEDRISQVYDTTNSYYTFKNISNAETKGLELSLNYQIQDNLSAGFNFMELRTEDKDTGKDLEFNPERTASLSFDYQATDTLNFGAVAKYIGEQHYTDSQTSQEKTTDAFTQVDLNVNYDIKEDYTVYGGINNIFDEDIDDVLGSSVGRYYFVGLNVSF